MAGVCNSKVVRVSIPSSLEWLGVIDRVVMEIAAQSGLSEKIANEIAISVVEAGTNAIQHGHRGSAEKPVDFTFDLNDGRMQIVVFDRGPGFDVERVLNWNPTTPQALLAPRGRGIFIMKSLMDEVSFRIVKGEGCWVTLIKRFATSPS